MRGVVTRVGGLSQEGWGGGGACDNGVRRVAVWEGR